MSYRTRVVHVNMYRLGKESVTFPCGEQVQWAIDGEVSSNEAKYKDPTQMNRIGKEWETGARSRNDLDQPHLTIIKFQSQ